MNEIQRAWGGYKKMEKMLTCLDNSEISYDLSMIAFGAATAIVSKSGLCNGD